MEAFELAEDPGTASACRAPAEHFSTQRCTERHLDLYHELLGASPDYGPASAPAARRPSRTA